MLEAIYADNGDPEDYVRRHGLEQVSDEDVIVQTVARVLEEQQEAVKEYRAGKEKAFDFLMGQAMRALRGKANPGMVRQMLKKLL